jgi:hypothetical protein
MNVKAQVQTQLHFEAQKRKKQHLCPNPLLGNRLLKRSVLVGAERSRGSANQFPFLSRTV